MDISIENPKGSVRSGVDPDGQPWSVTLPASYGYIRRSLDADGEQVDVYLGDQPESDRVFVVDQKDLDTDAFDEHKAFLGFTNQAAVEQTYDAAFDDGRGPERRAAITEMSVDEFKTWIKEGDTTEPVRAEIDVVAPTEPAADVGEIVTQEETILDQRPTEPEADITPEQVHQVVDEAVGEGQWDTEQNPNFGTFSEIMVGTPHIDNMDQRQRATIIEQVQRGAYQAWQEAGEPGRFEPLPETETPIPETEAPVDETIAPEAETPAVQEEITEPAPETSGIISFDPDELLVDAQRFQYKEGGDVLGVSERLKGVKKWEPRRAGVAIVWEAKDGKRYIVDGHQRLGLAKRMKEEGQDARLNAWLLREADGVSAEEARAEAALKNIGEGTGTSVDAARIIREASPEALSGLPPTSALVSQGTSLSRLDNDLLRMVERGDVEGRYGAVIGEKAAEDPALQRALFKLFAKKAPTSVQMAEMLADQFVASRTADETTMTLFGTETEADSLMYDRAKVLDSAVKLLNDDRRLFGTLVGKSNAIAAAGNVLDEQGNVQRKADTETVLAYVNAQANVKGPISDALTEAANDVRAGGRVKNAARKFVEAIREIPPQSQPRDVEPSGTPAPLFEEGGEPAAAPDAGTGEPGLFPGGRPEPGDQGVQREPASEEPVADVEVLGQTEDGQYVIQDDSGREVLVRLRNGRVESMEFSDPTQVRTGAGGLFQFPVEPERAQRAIEQYQAAQAAIEEEARNLPSEEPVAADTQTQPMFSRPEDIAAAVADPAVTEELTAIAQRLAPQATFTAEPELRDEAGREIQGLFETQGKEQIIRVALSGNPVESLGHESIHALKQAGLFADAEWAGLERAAQENDWLGTFNIPDRYSDLDTAGQLEEAVASAFGRYLTEGEVAGVTGEAEQPSMLRRVFDRLRAFFRDVGRALRGGDTEVSPTNIFEEVQSGELRRSAG